MMILKILLLFLSVAQHCLGTSGTQKKEQIIVSEEPEHGFDLNEPWVVAQQNDNDILGTARILLDLNEPAASQDEEKDPAPQDDEDPAPQDDEDELAAGQDEEKDEPAPQDEEEYQNMNALASSSNQKVIEQPNPSEKAQLEYSTITTEKSYDDKHNEAQNIDPLSETDKKKIPRKQRSKRPRPPIQVRELSKKYSRLQIDKNQKIPKKQRSKRPYNKENSQNKQKIVPFCASSSKNGTSKDGVGQEMAPEARHRKRRGAEDKDTHNIENSVIEKTTQDGQQSRTNEKLEQKSQEGSSTSRTTSGRRKYVERSSSADQFSTNSEKNLKGKKAKTTKPSRLTIEKQKKENENSQSYVVEKILAMYSYGKDEHLYFVDWQGYIDEESWIRSKWMSTQELVVDFVEKCTIGAVAQAFLGNEDVPEHIAEKLNKNEKFLKLMQTMGKDPTKMKTTKFSFAAYITPKQKEKAIASIDEFLKAEQISK